MEDFYSGKLDVWFAIAPVCHISSIPETQEASYTANHTSSFLESWSTRKMESWFAIFVLTLHFLPLKVVYSLPCKWVMNAKCARYGMCPYLPVPVPSHSRKVANT